MNTLYWQRNLLHFKKFYEFFYIFMKKWYIILIVVIIALFALILGYKAKIFSKIWWDKQNQASYAWSFTGASFITTFSDKYSPVKDAKSTHACLAWNDESCFSIVVRSGSYKSYFQAYWTAMYNQMINATGSEVSEDDLTAQLSAGYSEVRTVEWTEDTIRHLVDIGLEAQHLYIERPWGTLIVTDMLGLKGQSYPERTYIEYVDIPKYILVK